MPRLDVAPLRKALRPGAGPKAGRAPRTVRVDAGLRVKVWSAADDDGKAHGTLLRIVAAKPEPQTTGRAGSRAAPRRGSAAGPAPRSAG